MVFHGNFYIYFDVARMDYLRGLGLLEGFIAGQSLNLVVHASADFRSPAPASTTSWSSRPGSPGSASPR